MLGSPLRSRRFQRADGDERLVARVRDGDDRAFEAIYDRYATGLVSFCRHMLGSQEGAEDAVQHSLLAAHRALLADDRPIQLKAWLYTIARNRCLSILRARRDELALDDVVGVVGSTAGLAAEVEQRADLRELVGDVARLPDDQRAALVLAELGAHSHDDIAEVLDVRRDKVKALVFQARESLLAVRSARDAPCHEIRRELATASGAALRRSHLRRHLDVCEGCRDFRDEVRRQRAALAIVLPVLPSVALRHAVLAATGGGGAALGGGGALGGATATGVGAGVKGVAAKVLAAAVLAGGVGGGYVAVHAVAGGNGTAPARAAVATSHLPAGATELVAATLPATARPTPLPAPRHHAAARDRPAAHAAGGRATTPAQHARREHPKRAVVAPARRRALSRHRASPPPLSVRRSPTHRVARPRPQPVAPRPSPAASPSPVPTVPVPAAPATSAPTVSAPSGSGDRADFAHPGHHHHGHPDGVPPGLDKPFPGEGHHYGRGGGHDGSGD